MTSPIELAMNPQLRTGAMVGVSAALLAGGLLMRMRAKSCLRFRNRRAFMPVRDAGPANMEFAPESWDRVDQACDESFPASDPPPHCIRSRFR
jgi:hypothetical protein